MKIAAFADLTPNTHPALTFSGWLASASSEQTILAARHVIDEASVSLLLEALEGQSEIQRQAHARLGRAVKAAGGTWQQVEVTSAPTVLEGVTSCCDDDLQPDLLVLARHGAHGPAFLRLGRTVRNLLHDPPVAVAIVPMDWTPPSKPGGVLVMARPGDAPGVLEFGQGLAHQLGQDLHVRYAAPDPVATVEYYFTTPVLEELQRERRKTSTAAFERWGKAHKLDNEQLGVELGTPLEVAQRAVGELSPSLVVVGHTTKHHLAFGTAADLASHLPVPVVTVPILDA